MWVQEDVTLVVNVLTTLQVSNSFLKSYFPQFHHCPAFSPLFCVRRFA